MASRKKQIKDERRNLIILTLLYPLAMIAFTILRVRSFEAIPLSNLLLSIFALLIAGFASAKIFTEVLKQTKTKLQAKIISLTYILTYPFFIIFGVIGGQILGHLAPIVGAIIQGLILTLVFTTIKLVKTLK